MKMRPVYEYALVLLAAGLIMYAPLIRSGKTTTALMTMEFLGIAMLLIIFWGKLLEGRLQWHIKWFLLGSIGIALAYLIPLPDSLWSSLPGRGWYAEHANWMSAGNDEYIYRALSLVPYRTVAGLLALLAPLAIFLTVASLPKRKVLFLVYIFLLTAFGQAILSMAQYFIQDQALFFRIWSGNIPLGTYINQNHFVAFMEMAEPLALGLMIYAIVHPTKNVLFKTILAFLFGCISLALTFTPLLSASRMGTALLLLSIFLSFWVMTTPDIRKQVMAPIVALRFVLLALAIIIQFNVIHRIATDSYTEGFEPRVIAGDLRWEMYTSMWQGVKDFFPIGSGPGTMPQVYQTYQPTSINLFMNHAHNDYLELVFDMGIFGILILATLLFIYLLRWKQLTGEESNRFKLLKSGAGVGILLALLYSLTDFGLHTPANAVFFAFLFGIFLYRDTPSDKHTEAGLA